MTRPFFAKQRVADHDLFERYSEMTIALLKERLEDGHAVDFQVSFPFEFLNFLRVNVAHRMLYLDSPWMHRLNLFLEEVWTR